MKRFYLCLIALMLVAGAAWADPPVVDAGWSVFTIRNGATGSPVIQDNDEIVTDAIEIATWESGQKVGLGTNQLNGIKVSQIGSLNIDRLDDLATTQSLWGPYFNIWVTDGAGHYAVIANEPSNAEWAASRWYVSDWDYLRTKTCKLYETTGLVNGTPGTSWVATAIGKTGPLTFEDVGNLTIAPPPPAYLADPLNGTTTGAPDELGTNVAYGYNWIFGDTMANYVTTLDGYIVDNYYVTVDFPVMNVTQATGYFTIEAALAAAAPGNVITIGAGTYNPPATLNVTMPLTITGAGSGLVTINIPAAGGYGMYVAADDVTLSGFTLIANTTNEQYPIHASGTTAPGGFDNLSISDVTVAGTHRRAGVDIHGYNNVTLAGITSRDATGGNGLQLTGVVGASVSGITTLNNAWGSISIYCSQFMLRASTGVTIDGDSCSLAEKMIFQEDGYGLFSTGTVVSGYEYGVRNPVHRAGGELYYFFQDTLGDAVALAVALDGAAVGSTVRPLAGGAYIVEAGMHIQPAIDAAVSGDAITVGAGTYEEQLHVNKNNLVITGAGVGTTVVRSPVSLPLYYITSGTTQNKPVVFVDGCTGLQMSGLTVDGAGRGNLNNRFQGVGFWNAGGSLANASVINVMDTPFSGVQHGVGIYAYNNTGGPYTITLNDVFVTSFQKNATALSGNGLTVALNNVTAVGAGPTAITAQNGLQVSYGAGGTLTNCSVSGIAYTGASWSASGVLLYAGAPVTAQNVDVAGSQGSIFCQDSSANFTGTDVTACTGDAFYVYNTAAKALDVNRRAAQPMDDGMPAGALKSAVVVNVANSTFAGTGVADSWGIGSYATSPVEFNVTGCEVTNFDYGVMVYQAAGGSFDASVTGCNIHDNLSYGLYTNATALVDADCNWWGDVDGPAIAGNPSAGDAISTGATYAPWLDAVGGNCVMYGDNNVSVGDAPACVTSATACVSLPVTFNRLDTTDSRGVSVTFQLSPELVLCTGDPYADVVMATGAGTWAGSFGNAMNQVVDNGGGSYTMDLAILGTPCGPANGGTLFFVNVKPSPAVTTEAIGTVTVTAVDVRDCANAPLAGIPGAAGEVAINLTTPAALAGLVAAQDKDGNDSDGTTKINLSWTAVTGDADFITIWRKGFGDYPEYNDGTGAVPAGPVTAGNGWVLAATLPATSTGYADEPATRDFWYYAAYVADECGNTSPVSAITGGTLNYHLGDVSDTFTAGAGNNLVGTEDISLLGGAYGITLTPYGDALNYLDVGPTTDYSVDARPTTDNRVQFEDLMVFAMNYYQVSKVDPQVAPADANAIALAVGEAGSVGSTFDVAVVLAANGKLQGLSVPLQWDAAVVEPVGMAAGDMLAAYGSQALVLSPAAGTVDAALMGVREKAIAGQGILATVTFRVLAEGNTSVTLGSVTARDKDNRPLVMGGAVNDLPPVSLPAMSVLQANVPNPFNPSTEFSFVLAKDGPVTLRVYSVRGELVRTLVDEAMTAGPHSLTWNGLDDQGRQAASGAYVVRFVAPDRTQSRQVMLLK